MLVPILLTSLPDDSDLVWSDPEDIETWSVSPRGAGWLFGAKVTAEVGLRHVTKLSLGSLDITV